MERAIAHAPERPVPELACENLPHRRKDHKFRGFMTLGWMTTRIRAGSFGPNEAALVVDTQSSRTMSILNKNRKFFFHGYAAHRAGLFLRKQQAAVFRADDNVVIV